MEKNENYHTQMTNQNTLKLREIMLTLPSFCKQFFRGIEPTTSSRTRIGYAFDLRIFFEFLQSHHVSFKSIPLTEMTLDSLNKLSREDIEEYLEYLSYYEKEGKIFTNDERGKSRKLASLRSFFQYFFTS